ncbi:FAD-binding domain-containing protein [Acidimangrovimonas pyrenivorans]|uniref:FAD-binding domain-containing protein n=1 Tax=Acidimangrovimonas pyrenivorans TaxID=2030798 RepID=A0ABV7AGZ2_9RHOB
MNVLIRFSRDLRAADHPALSHAAALAAGRGAVLPLYVVDPAAWAAPDRSARQWDFTAECLEDLRAELAALGAPLVLRVGPARAVLERLCRQHGIGAIVSHPAEGTVEEVARDRALADWARGQGIDWIEMPQGAAEVPAALRPVAGVAPGPIPTARALRLAEDRCPNRQQGGRTQGLAMLESFLAARAAGYRAGASVTAAERGASRLSPYLAQGVLSREEVAAAAAARRATRPGRDWTRGLRAFEARLARRDGDALARVPTAAPLPEAYARGETGLPFLDATLRYLAATGWLPAELREMTAQAARLLGVEAGAGLHLARSFTDYHPALFWPAWQAALARRPVDPLRLGRRMDPRGAFLRSWLPELAPVPEAHLHAPWLWSGAQGLLGRRYPEPLVDPAAARRALRPAAQPGRRRRTAAAPAGQLCLDL